MQQEKKREVVNVGEGKKKKDDARQVGSLMCLCADGRTGYVVTVSLQSTVCMYVVLCTYCVGSYVLYLVATTGNCYALRSLHYITLHRIYSTCRIVYMYSN